MRKGQQKYIDNIKNENPSEELLELFKDESYNLYMYEYFWTVRKYDVSLIKKNVDYVSMHHKKWGGCSQYVVKSVYIFLCEFYGRITEAMIDYLFNNCCACFFLKKTKDLQTLSAAIELLDIFSKKNNNFSSSFELFRWRQKYK